MSLQKPLLTPECWEARNLLAAIQYAAKKLFFSVDRKNMNRRPLTESLDDKIMGEVATVAVVEYLRAVGVSAASYDQFRIDGFKRPDPGWDILCGPGTYGWIKRDDRVGGRPEAIKTASVKSSRLPKGDSLQTAIAKRDFKILAKQGQSLEQALTADIEMQVYFEREKSWLPKGCMVTVDEVQACIEAREKGEVLRRKLKIDQRFGTCYLAAWHGREQIVLESAKLAKRQWTSRHAGSQKMMWCAPLRNGRSFVELKDEVLKR